MTRLFMLARIESRASGSHVVAAIQITPARNRRSGWRRQELETA